MNKQMPIENLNFEEEIPSSFVDPDEFYKMKRSKKKRIFLLILFFLLLTVFISVFYFYFYNESKKNNPNFKINQDLLVVHSKTDFGDELTSFGSYPSYEKAYTYSFYLENKNKLEIPYMIYLESFDNTSDLSKISYAVLKDDEILFQGNLVESKTKIVASKIFPSSIHHYSLKLWSTNADARMKFKIYVEVS